jgi:hypothetical protein
MTPEAEPDEYLVEHVREHLIHDSRIRELDIHVVMHGSTLVVTGNVGTEERRVAITEALDALLPHHAVRNDTTVSDYTEVSEETLP